jgi:cytochrome c oxidase subunit 4
MNVHHTQGLAHEIRVPKEKDYHGHPNYLKVYIILLILFAITVFASLIPNPIVVFAVVFSISVVKGTMVLLYFMHLKWEPNLIWIMLIMALLTLLFLMVGLYPDIVPVENYLVPKP